MPFLPGYHSLLSLLRGLCVRSARPLYASAATNAPYIGVSTSSSTEHSTRLTLCMAALGCRLSLPYAISTWMRSFPATPCVSTSRWTRCNGAQASRTHSLEKGQYITPHPIVLIRAPALVTGPLEGHSVVPLRSSLIPSSIVPPCFFTYLFMMLSRTSTSSSLSDHSSRSLLTSLPTGSKVLATAEAKVYHLPFGSRAEHWNYSGLAGTLIFGRNCAAVHADRKLGVGSSTTFSQTYWFRLIDPAKGLIWMHEIPTAFDYALDKPFFHTFSGKSRMFGFRFDDDVQAAKFLQKISSHVEHKAPSVRKSKKFEFASMKRRITPSMISPPAAGTFVHLGHVGFNSKGEIEASDDVESGWTMMIEEIQGYSVSKPLTGVDGKSLVEAKTPPLVAEVTPEGIDQPLTSLKGRKSTTHRSNTVKFA